MTNQKTTPVGAALRCARFSVGLLSVVASGGQAFAADATFGNNAGVAYSDELETKPYVWISDKLSFKPSSQSEQSSFASKAEYWGSSKWGVSGNFSTNDAQLFGVPENSEFKNIDVNRKVLGSQNSANYLAVGLGWQEIDIADQINAKGASFSLLGKLNFAKRFQVYGNSSWFQELGAQSSANVSGYQLEAGLLFQPRSSLSLTAGLKVLDLDGSQYGASNASSSSFSLGTSLTF